MSSFAPPSGSGDMTYAYAYNVFPKQTTRYWLEKGDPQAWIFKAKPYERELRNFKVEEITAYTAIGLRSKYHWYMEVITMDGSTFWYEMHDNGTALRGPIGPHHSRYQGSKVLRLDQSQLRPRLGLYELVHFTVPKYSTKTFNCHDFVYSVLYHAVRPEYLVSPSRSRYFGLSYWYFEGLTVTKLPGNQVHVDSPEPEKWGSWTKDIAWPIWLLEERRRRSIKEQ